MLGRKELRKIKDDIIHMYVDEKKSTYEIGAIVGAYNCTVAYILKENGI